MKGTCSERSGTSDRAATARERCLRYFITFACYGARLHGDEAASVDRRHDLVSARWLWNDEDVRHAPQCVIDEQGDPMAVFVAEERPLPCGRGSVSGVRSSLLCRTPLLSYGLRVQVDEPSVISSFWLTAISLNSWISPFGQRTSRRVAFSACPVRNKASDRSANNSCRRS